MMKKTLSVLMLSALPVLALAGGNHQGGHDMAGHDYEINRQFAPYLGIEWKAKYGKTASLARREGLEARQTRVVAGLRFWF